jgi:hypothetical protein
MKKNMWVYLALGGVGLGILYAYTRSKQKPTVGASGADIIAYYQGAPTQEQIAAKAAQTAPTGRLLTTSEIQALSETERTAYINWLMQYGTKL